MPTGISLYSGVFQRTPALAARTLLIGLFTALLMSASANAQDVNITQDLPFFEFDNGQDFFVIERNQDQEAIIPDTFAKTSRPCPPFCIQPMQAAEGVETIGELELMAFLEQHVQNQTGALIDARLESWYRGGTIPGSVNFAFNLFESPDQNPFLEPVLQILGGVHKDDGTWDFSKAKELALFCNGPWCGQSPRAIRNLVAVGYPPERIRYYRGGMQAWLALGLTVYVPGSGA